VRGPASKSNVAMMVGLVLVAAVAGALIHAGLPRERADASVRRAFASQQALARTLAAERTTQEAYGMVSSVAAYLASLDAFGAHPPASLARYTIAAPSLRAQTRNARVDVIASLGPVLAAHAVDLRRIGALDPVLARVLAPTETSTLDALRRGPAPVDPLPYAAALDELQRSVTQGTEDSAAAGRLLGQVRLEPRAPLQPLPFGAGIACLVVVAFLAALVLRSARRDRSLAERAGTDPLTGAANRRRLEEDLERGEAHVAVLMIDLDHFKSLNDGAGHAAGDEALRRVATAVGACLRRQDVLYRYGGEEFCVLLRDTTAEDAAVVAERIRAVVEAVPVPGEEALPGGRLTASIGVAAQPDARAGVETADALLYVAKTDGRNRVRA
jgi:diguanylate cyclase (GGDEF)-like protein